MKRWIMLALMAGAAATYGDVTWDNRPQPLRHLDVVRTVWANDFGAVPNDGVNDRPAMIEAFKAVHAMDEPVELAFKQGRYLINNDDFEPKMAFTLVGLDNVVINGNGSEFIIQNPNMGFMRLVECKNLIIRDMTFDYDPLPFTETIVRSVDPEEKSFEVEVLDGFPNLNAPNFITADFGRWGRLMDPEIPGRHKISTTNAIFSSDPIQVGDRRFRFVLDRQYQIDQFTPGDRYIRIARSLQAAIFMYSRCENVTFQRITIFTAGSANYAGGGGGNLAFLNCSTLIKPGRWQSTNADGVYCSGMRVGPWIEGCIFEGNADDGANLLTHPLTCIKRINDRSFELMGSTDVRAGDQFALYDMTQGRILARPKVIAAEELEFYAFGVTFDQPLPFVTEDSDAFTCGFYNESAMSQGFVIRNNIYRANRRFALQCQSRDGLIENNLFDGQSTRAINIGNSPPEPEGWMPRNLVIRNNTFKDCGREYPWESHPSGFIRTSFLKEGWKNIPEPLVGPILIENNHFENWRSGAVISLGAAKDVTVRNNTFETLDPDVEIIDPKSHSVVRVVSSANVTIEGNTITDVRPYTNPPIWVEDDSIATTVIKNNTVHVPNDGQ